MARKKRYLKIVLKDEVVEEPFALSFLIPKASLDFRRLIGLLRGARHRKRLEAVVLVMKKPSLGWGQVEEIQDQFRELRDAGKRTLAFLEAGGNLDYYLAASSDKVYMAPASTLDLVGLRVESLHLKRLLDRFGIHPQLYRRGKYKAAGEMFTHEKMSDSNREMTDSILEDIQQRMVEQVAAARRASLETVREWLDSGPFTALEAARKGLLDGTCYEDELPAMLGDPEQWVELSPSKLDAREGLFKRLITFRRPQVAYLVAEGILTTGESRSGAGRSPFVGSDTLVRALRTIRKRKRIKAVVLRVNSPGGSALASDLIWRELRLTDEGKPVIVSFGNVAASGGYYIATAGRRIFSSPSTFTGSIGVLGGKVNLGKFLETQGITVDSVTKGRHAGHSSPTQPYSEEEARIVDDQIGSFYEDFFLKRVADSRQREIDEIRRWADGRVWTGRQAAAVGLVDSVGGVSEAMASARREAGVPEQKKVRVVQFARKRTLLDLLSLPRLGTLSPLRILALAVLNWRIR